MMALVPKTPASDAAYFRTLSVATALALLLAGLSGGAVRTWTGGGANDNWSTGGNWGGTAPAPGDDLHFAGSTRLTPVNDIAGGNFNSITFDAGAGPFTVTGNAVTLTGGSIAITHGGAGNATVNLPITLGTGSTFMNTSAGMLTLGGSVTLGSYSLTVQAAGNTEMHGIISGSGYLTKTGGGTLKVSGSNTYTGTTTVSSGILILDGPSALGTAAGGVTVAAGASLDLNGMNYSALEPLTLNGIGPSGIGALINSAASPATFGGPLTLGGASSIVGESGPIVLTHTGAISGGYPLTLAGTQGGSLSGAFVSASLTKAGTGTWTLENDDGFTSLTLSSGTLHLGSGRTHVVSTSLNLSGGNLHFGSSALEFQGSSVDFSSLASIVAAGGTLGFSSASAQAFLPKPGAAFPPIVKSGAGNLILNSYGLTAAGLALNGGSWDWSTYAHSLGSIASTSGNMLFNSSTVEITGDCDLSGLSSVAGAAAYLDFTGTGAQTFTPKAGGATHPHVRKAGNGTLTLAGDLATGSLLVSDGTFDLAAHSVIVNADLNVSGGTLRADDASLTVYASATISGGTLRMPADAMTVQQSFTAAASTLVHNSGTLTMTSPTTGRILDIDGAIHNLTLNGSGGVWTVSNHPLTLDGVLTLSAGYLVLGNSMAHSAGSLAFTAGNLDFGTACTMAVTSGNADFSGLSALTMGAGNTLAFTAASGTQTFTPHASYSLHAVTKSGAGSVLMAGSPLIANGLSMSAGTWDWGASTLTHSLATLDATGGTMTFGSNKVKASGNVDLSGLAAINPGTGTLWFDGSGPRNFTPKPGAAHPKIDHSGLGVTTLTGNSLVAGALSMNGGTLSLGAGLNHAIASVSATWGTLDFASSTLRVTSGDADFSGLAGLTAGTGALEFTGTAAQNLTPHSGSNLPALKQNGAGGTTILASGTTTPSITIASGTLHLGSGLVHASGNFASTGGGLDFQTSTLDLSGSTLDFSGLTGMTPDAGTLGFQGSSPQTFTPVSGGVFPNLNKPGSGAVTLAGALSAKAVGMSNGSLALGNFTHSVASFTASGGALDFGGSTLHVTEGQAYLGGLASLTPGTGTLDFNGTGSAQLLTPKSGSTHPAVTHTGTAILRLTNYGLISQGFSQSAGTLDFNNQNITTAGNFTITNGTPSSFTGLGGRTLTVVGNASLSGSSTASRLNLDPGAAWTMTVSSGTLNAVHAAIAYGTAAGAAGLCTNCTESGGNVNWSFPVTWDGGGTDNYWSTADNWGSKSVPTAGQDVAFDAGSNKDVTLSANVSVRSLNMTGYTGTVDFSSFKLTIAEGDADFRGGETIIPGTGILEFSGAGPQIFHAKAGEVFPNLLKTGGGATTLGTNALTAGNLDVAGGAFNLGSAANTHSVDAITGNGGLDFGAAHLAARGNVDLSNSTVTVAGANTLSFTGTTPQTYTPNASEPDLGLIQNGTGGTTLAGNITVPSLSIVSGVFSLGTGRNHSITGTVSSSGGTLAFGSGNAVHFTGTTMDLSSLSAVTYATGTTLFFQGGGSRSLTPHPTGTLPGIVQNGSGGTLILTGNLNAMALSVDAGTLNLGAGRTHAIGTFASTAGALDFGSSTLKVSGNSAGFNGLTAINPGTGLLEFTGGSAQAFTPSGTQTLPSVLQSGAGTTSVTGYDLSTINLTLSAGGLDIGVRTLNATGNLSVSAGTFTANGGHINLAGNLSATGGSVVFPASGNHFGVRGGILIGSAATVSHYSGTITLEGTASGKTIDIDNIIYGLTVNGSGGDWTVVNHPLVGDGALTLVNGTLSLGSALLHRMGSFTSSGSNATLDFGSSTLRILYTSADFTGLANLIPGTGTLEFSASTGTQTLTAMNGSATHPFVTHTGAGTLQLGAYPLVCKGFAQTAGIFDFNGRNLTVNNSGNLSIANGTPSSIANLGGAILTVNGNASLSGTSAAGKLNLNPGSAWTLAVTGALTGSFASLGNSNATVSAGSCSNCSNAGANANWSFSTAWDGGGADDNWSSALNWGGNVVPTSVEDVIFDATSVKNVTVNTAVTLKSLTLTPGYTGTFSFSTSALTVTGNADFRSGGTIAAGTGSLVFTGTSGQVFHPKPGAVFPGIQQNGIGGTTVSGSAFSCGNLTLTSGSFNLGSGFTHTVAGISGSGGLDFGSSNINATGATVNLSAMTVTAATSNTLAFTGSVTTFTPKPTLTTLKLYVGGTGNVLANGNITTPYLTLASGTLGLGTGRTHLVTNAIAISGGSLDFGSSSLQTASATLDLRNLAGLVPGTGSLQFTGASAQAFIPHASLPLPHLMQNGIGGTTVITNPLISSNALSILAGSLHLGTGLVHTVASLGGSGGSGALDFGSSTLRIATGNASLNLLASVTAGTGVLEFTAASGIQNFSPLSGYASPAISHSGAGTLRLAGTTTAASFSQTAGTFDLNGVDFSVAGNFTVANGNSASFAGLTGRTITVGGNAAINGTSPANRANLNPVAAWTLAVTGGLSANLATLAFSNASAASGSCTDCANGGNNINWDFFTVWSGGGTDNLWSNALNWSSLTVPTSAENITFNSTSLKNVLLDADAGVKTLTFAPGYTGTMDFADKILSVNGNADFAGGETLIPGSGALAFTGASAQTFKPKTGAAFPAVIVNGAGGVTLTNALASAGLTLTAGTLGLGAGFTHSVGFVSGAGTLDFGSSELEASGNVDVSLATVVPGSGTLRFSASSTQTFSPKAGAVYPALVFAGSGIRTVAGNGFTAPSLSLTAGTLNLGTGLVHAVTDALSISGGNLDFGSSELRVAGSTVDFSALSTLIAGTGTLAFTGNSAQTLIPLAATAHPSISHPGTGLMSIAGNLTAPALAIGNGGVHLGSGRTHVLASLTSTGGALDFGSSTVNLTGAAADFSGLGTLTANSGKLVFTAATGSQILTPKAASLHPAIEHNGSALLILDAADLVCASFLQQAGFLDFNGRNLTVAGSGNLGIFNGASNTLINLGGRTLTVGGAATLLGQPANHLNLDPAAPWTLSVAGALKAVNADIRNSLAASSAGIADSSRNLAGNSNWTFLDTLLPENISAFQAAALDGHSVALAWNASVAADADSVMLRYRTDGIPPQNAADGALWRSVPASKNADTATGMADKTVFHFAAFVRDSSGNFALKTGGSTDSAATPDVTAPANVEAFTATAAGPTSAALAWNASTSTDVDSIVIRYRADGDYPSDASDGTLWKRLSASASGETVTGLSPNIVYHFAAFTADSSGNVAAASVQARDSALYQLPVSGSVSIADNQGRLRSPMAALAFTWSNADSLRFALPADTAAASWSGVRALDSLSIAAGPDGLRVILAQFKNIHGLKSPWYKDTTLLDRAPPAVTLAANAEHSWRNWPDALSGKALDAGAGTDSVHVIRKRVADGAYFNGAGWSTVADTADLRADSVFSVPMPNSAMTTGAYDFTAYARDRIGNVSAPLTVRVDYVENRTPALASSTLADSLPQNQPAAWTLEIGDPDAGDSLATVSATLPAWLTMTESADTAQGGFSTRRIYSLAGKPQQADVGNATVTIQTVDLGGRIFTFTKSIKIPDVNDPPLFAKDADSAFAQEDSVSGYRPLYADQDPHDVHTLSLLQAPAWVTLKDSALVFKPGSRDAGTAMVRVAVSDGELADTLDLKIGVANVNDAPVAFPSTRFETRPDWKEDVTDSFTVVVVDMDKGDPVTLVSVLPAWIGYQATVDPVDGFNRFFRFQVNPKQADTGSHPLKLSFRDASGAVSELPLEARVAAVNDTPTAVIKESRTVAGAARIALDVADHDGNAAATRFHYRLVAASGDTVRRGISAASILSLHPLADGAYRLAVRAEDEGGLKQTGFTTSDLRISGATAIGLDSARWSMIAYPGRSLSASALGSGYAVTTWDESSSDGSPLGRYATGPAADSLARGKGYWVRLAKPLNLAAPLADLLDKPFTLKLTHGRQGWNQMGNPFPYFVDVSAAGLQFWEWDAIRRDLVDAKGILKPWGAYWVQVAKDTTLTLRDEPYFAPVQAASGALAKSAGPASPALRASDWTLQMLLQAGPYQDRANYLGIRNVTQAGPMAAAGRVPGAAGQVPDAPKYGDYIALHFERPGTEAIGAKYAAVNAGPAGGAQGDAGLHAHALGYAEDFRNGMGDDEEWWDFSVENSQSGFSTAALSIPGLENLQAAGLHAFLVRRGQAALLVAGEPAILAMEGRSTPYSIVVTPHADFAGRMRGDFSISQNFPNPVRTHTTFRFALPQTWDASGRREARSYRLRLNVYDYSGRLAARVTEGVFKPGVHSLVWKPQAVNGGDLAKGAYIYRLEVPGFSKSLKLLLK